ncbi:MAG: redoxin domain-containing protein [Acidobacteria bacterium]|nr:redoxin domain-containing protein [Acidobacteriota bacterium]
MRELTAYQADIAHFENTGTQILGISVDSSPANKRFAEDLKLTFPLLSDFKRTVSKQYGILNEEREIAVRTTYVLDKQGVIKSVEQGSVAIDPSGAKAMCSLLK